jgi:hypothetical protein
VKGLAVAIGRATLTLLVISVLAAAGGCSARGSAEETRGTTAVQTGGEGADATGVEPPPPGSDEELIVTFDGEVEQIGLELSSALGAAGGPDCELAGELRDRICDLATRICEIAGRNPDHPDATRQCDDGQDRCTRATRDVADSCEEE